MRNVRLGSLLFAFATAALTACGGAESPASPGSANGVVVTIDPASASVSPGGTKAFTASVTGTANLAVTWSLLEGATAGTVSSGGLYTAPSSTGTFHVVATSQASPSSFAEAQVVVATSVNVAVNPSSATISTGGNVTLAATVTGTTNTAVSWSVQEASGGSVSSTGVYTAPGTPGTYHVIAQSLADANARATATITVTATSAGLAITPSQTMTTTGATVQFSASDAAATWAAPQTNSGSITGAGLYTAPSTPGTYVVTATNATQGAMATVVVKPATPDAPSQWVSGYWADWGVSVPGGGMPYQATATSSNMPWNKLTHLIIAFGIISGSGSSATLSTHTSGNLENNVVQRLVADGHAAGKKVLLSFGGAGSAIAWQNFVSNSQTDTTTAAAAAQVMYTYAHDTLGLDGIDVDWESLPYNDTSCDNNGCGIQLERFMKALRALWPSGTFTLAIPWAQTSMSWLANLKDNGGNWVFDQFNVMNYDGNQMWPAWVTWFTNAAFDGGSNRPSAMSLNLGQLATVGIPKSRIGMGLGFYGSAWSTSNQVAPQVL